MGRHRSVRNLRMPEVCKTWQRPIEFLLPLCANKLEPIQGQGSCAVCATPVNPTHTPCCCPSPKLSHRVLTLTAAYTGSGTLPCSHTSAFGIFSMLGNDCGFQSVVKNVNITSDVFVNPMTCAVEALGSARWHIAPTSCFDVGPNKWMACSAIYTYRLFNGSTANISFTGVIPACNDVNGAWVFSSGSFPDWQITVAGL